jgi:MbtH protein
MGNSIRYYIVINEEEQYSIWPEWKDVPTGWKIVGQPLSKELCLEEIERIWTDMRPLSVRPMIK